MPNSIAVPLGERTDVLRALFPDHDRLAQASLKELRGRFEGPAPKRGFLLCITPRSGSSMLSDVLARTGAVGKAEEHFPSSAAAPLPAWMVECGGVDGVLAALGRHAPAGYFGIKGDLFQLFPLIAANRFTGAQCELRHIYLTRRNRVGQAVSLARAVRTNQWHSSDPWVADPELTFREILERLHYIRTMESDWETVFTALGVKPLRLVYEEVVANQVETFERIRTHLDVEWRVPPAQITSTYEPLRERYNPEWLRRMRSAFDPPRVVGGVELNSASLVRAEWECCNAEKFQNDLVPTSKDR